MGNNGLGVVIIQYRLHAFGVMSLHGIVVGKAKLATHGAQILST